MQQLSKNEKKNILNTFSLKSKNMVAVYKRCQLISIKNPFLLLTNNYVIN